MTREELLAHCEGVTQKCLGIMRKKNADYSREADPFTNFTSSAALIDVPVEKTFINEVGKKLTRVINLLSKEATVDESIEDSLEDSVNYILLLHAYLASKNRTRILGRRQDSGTLAQPTNGNTGQTTGDDTPSYGTGLTDARPDPDLPRVTETED